MEEDEDPIAGGKTGFFINNKTKQTNKNYPVGEKQTARTEQGRTGHKTYDDDIWH